MTLVRIHSKLILDYPESASTYYYLRSFDKQGSGWIRVSVKISAMQLGISTGGFMQRIKRMKQQGFLYAYEQRKGVLWIKYVGIEKLKEKSAGVFASAKVELKTLLDVLAVKKAAYAHAIARQQNACRYTAKDKSKLWEPKLNKDGSANAAGCVHINKGRQFFVKLGKHVVGASQLTLAQVLGRSRSTVQRWVHKFDSARIWIRQRLETNPLPGTYCTYKLYRNENGKVLRREYQFRQMPNFYFVDEIDPKHEKAQEGDPLWSPRRLEIQQRSESADKTSTIKLIVEAPKKRVAYSSFKEKLLWNCNRVKIDKLAIAWYQMFFGVEIALEKVQEFTLDQLTNALSQTYEQLNPWQRDLADISYNRTIKNRSAIPPTYTCCGRQSLAYLLNQQPA